LKNPGVNDVRTTGGPSNPDTPNDRLQNLSDLHGDAIIAIDVIYEQAVAGSEGAETVLRYLADELVQRAMRWKIRGEI
jgi:hypothetical protein